MIESIEDYTRKLIKNHNLDCYILFNSDLHLNEYIRKVDMRVFEISGFSGSNGTVIISEEPCLITDSRYYIQAQNESKFPLFKEKITDYLVLKKYKRVSFDTKTISSTNFKKLIEKFNENSIEFINTEFNFNIKSEKEQEREIIYLEKYLLKNFLHFSEESERVEYDPKIKEYLNLLGFNKFEGNVTGSFYGDKIKKIRDIIQEKTLIVTELDTICWILNLRGFDIECNPVFFSFLIINENEILLFTDKKVILKDVKIYPYSEFDSFINTLHSEVLISGDCNQFIFSKFENIEIIETIRELQATKNEIELCGMALAYFFDGVALTELFGFINNNINLTENDISDKLHNIKSKFKGYVQPSFDTISSTGPNAAIVHHRASSKMIDKDQVYLIDSGSQYYFGTTDTTRTLYFGSEISKELQHDYTLVLKGQLNAMMKKYTTESNFSEIDLISRKFLKEEEKDFGHSTGHGVGHFLCVHEHPPVISTNYEGRVKPNYVFSVEPGYYKDNEYGIRIENLVASRKVENEIELVNITLVPYQNKMVDVKMLTEEELRYYNESNERCIKILQDYIGYEAYEFLKNNSFKL